MATRFTQPSGYAGGSDNVLKTVNPGAERLAHSLTLGDTTVLGSSIVNALRFAFNKADGRQLPDAVLLAEGHRRRTSTATTRARWW